MQRFINKRILIATAVGTLIIGGFYIRERATILSENVVNTVSAATAAIVSLPFKYPFSVDGRLEEIGKPENSSSPYWWVSSGGFMDLVTGIGRTNQGELAIGSKWQKLYALSNPVDTDAGLHPQNIFRMVLRSNWQDISQQMYFRINRYVPSLSPNRNASNGILLMNRYLDENNLYYTGLRVDGYAVIKKKYQGRYYTLAYQRVLPGTYSLTNNTNLLSSNQEIGLKAVVKNLDAYRVSIRLYTDIGQTGTWTLAAQVTDDGRSYGGAALTGAGRGGVRTDFMDVQFDDYLIAPAP